MRRCECGPGDACCLSCEQEMEIRACRYCGTGTELCRGCFEAEWDEKEAAERGEE